MQAAPLVPPVHEMSHAHESEQSMSRHEPLPVHVTLHLPVPQSRSRHELCPLHTMVHELAPVQSIPDVHELAVEHPIVQFQPGGHTTSSLQLDVAQSITHSWRSKRHDVHSCGHMAASTVLPSRGPSIVPESPGDASSGALDVTQNPLTHVRPGNGSQSAGPAHSYSVLLWLIEQLLAAATNATTRATSHAATSFMV